MELGLTRVWLSKCSSDRHPEHSQAVCQVDDHSHADFLDLQQFIVSLFVFDVLGEDVRVKLFPWCAQYGSGKPGVEHGSITADGLKAIAVGHAR